MVKVAYLTSKAIEEYKEKYFSSLPLAVSPWLHEKTKETQYYELLYNGKGAGYICKNKDNVLLQFYVDPEFKIKAEEFFKYLLENKIIKGAYVMTFDSTLLSLCSDFHRKLVTQEYLFRDYQLKNDIEEEQNMEEIESARDLELLEELEALNRLQEEETAEILDNIETLGNIEVLENADQLQGLRNIESQDGDSVAENYTFNENNETIRNEEKIQPSKPLKPLYYRVAIEEDIKDIQELIAKNVPKEELEANIKEERLLVIEKYNTIIAIGELKPLPGEHFPCDLRVLVKKEYRDQGYGTYSLKSLKNYCIERGYTPCCSCEVENHPFVSTFKRAGFIPNHRTLYFKF